MVPGLCYRKERRLRPHIPESAADRGSNTLPGADYGSFPQRATFAQRARHVHDRLACTFCAVQQTMGQRLAKRYVRVFGFFMMGIPGEEEEDVQRTFELAKQLELDRWSWSIYSPLPGSPLYDDLISEGKIRPFALDHTSVHFTEAYEGICAVPPARLEALYGEINGHFARRQLAAAAD